MHPLSKQGTADGEEQELMLNIGLWGYGPPPPGDFLKANQDLERELRKMGGMKWLYAQTYYTEHAFWKMYDRKWYDSLRVKYDATSLTSVYEKVKIDLEAEKRAGNPSFEEALGSTWPVSGLYGLKKAIESGAYLQARDWAWKSIGETSPFNMKR